MAGVPRFKRLSVEDYKGAPEWVEPMFRTLNEVVGGVVDGMSRRLTRSQNFLASEAVAREFKTANHASDTEPATVKPDISVRPRHVVLSKLEKVSGGKITTAFSMSWRLLQTGEIELTFQGLEADTDYRFSITYE